MLYTAQYRYPGQDRLDITVKGNNVDGKLYAPTWDIVMGVKNGTITEEEYTRRYYDMLSNKHNNDVEAAKQTINLVKMVMGSENMPERDITLVCFCPANAFCHRHLLVKWLVHNFNIEKYYGGEKVEVNKVWLVR